MFHVAKPGSEAGWSAVESSFLLLGALSVAMTVGVRVIREVVSDTIQARYDTTCRKLLEIGGDGQANGSPVSGLGVRLRTWQQMFCSYLLSSLYLIENPSLKQKVKKEEQSR